MTFGVNIDIERVYKASNRVFDLVMIDPMAIMADSRDPKIGLQGFYEIGYGLNALLDGKEIDEMRFSSQAIADRFGSTYYPAAKRILEKNMAESTPYHKQSEQKRRQSPHSPDDYLTITQRLGWWDEQVKKNTTLKDVVKTISLSIEILKESGVWDYLNIRQMKTNESKLREMSEREPRFEEALRNIPHEYNQKYLTGAITVWLRKNPEPTDIMPTDISSKTTVSAIGNPHGKRLGTDLKPIMEHASDWVNNRSQFMADSPILGKVFQTYEDAIGRIPKLGYNLETSEKFCRDFYERLKEKRPTDYENVFSFTLMNIPNNNEAMECRSLIQALDNIIFNNNKYA